VGVPLSGQYFFELGLYFSSEYVLSHFVSVNLFFVSVNLFFPGQKFNNDLFGIALMKVT
jgi:hypothetical protein